MEKQALEELTKQNDLAMKRMDIGEDINCANTAAKAVRKFEDLNHDSTHDMEEFVGYNNLSSEDESDFSLTQLKVSFFADTNS